MSKGPETKDSTEARRKRRGGLRIPADKVPRHATSEGDIAAPVPEAVGLAATVSESFGITGGNAGTNGKDQPVSASSADPEEMATIVSDTPEPDDVRLDTEDDVTQLADSCSPGSMVAQGTPATAPGAESEDIDFSDEASIDEQPRASPRIPSPIAKPAPRPKRSDITTPSIIDTERSTTAESETSGDDETGDSVDIPFDDNEESSVTAAIPEAPSSPDAVSPEVKAASPAVAKASPALAKKPDAKRRLDTAEGESAGKKKPRFTRALTMALNESDLEEVRGGSKSDATPVEEASPVDSSDVIAEDDMEEISEEPQSKPNEGGLCAEARPTKKRAETAEPPPPPPPTQKAAKPTPKPVAKAPAPDDTKCRQRKPWFEELFDEDYLRTLPFLTPQATQFEANFVMESLGVEAGAQILDVGCGYGRHAMELAARGYHLVGLDSSLPLLLRGADEAQRRGLTINFVHGDMRDMTFESQFDGAYCLFSSFGYFDDETNKRTAQNIAKALKPGARFVVEVLNRDYLVADLPSRVWWEGDGCVVLEEVEFNYFSSRIVSNRSVVFDDGRQLEHEISLRSFSLHELGKFLHAVGFRVLEISGSMSTRGRFFGAHSRDIVVVAERRAASADEA